MRWNLNSIVVSGRGASWGFFSAQHLIPKFAMKELFQGPGLKKQVKEVKQLCDVMWDRRLPLCPFVMPEYTQLSVVVFICDPSIWKAEAGRLLKLPGYSVLHSETKSSRAIRQDTFSNIQTNKEITAELRNRESVDRQVHVVLTILKMGHKGSHMIEFLKWVTTQP